MILIFYSIYFRGTIGFRVKSANEFAVEAAGRTERTARSQPDKAGPDMLFDHAASVTTMTRPITITEPSLSCRNPLCPGRLKASKLGIGLI